MLDKAQLLDRGVGNWEEVAHFFCMQADAGGEIDPAISTLTVALGNIPETSVNRRAVAALLCAKCNQNLEVSGKLWSLGDDDLPKYDYIAAGAERTLVASLVCSAAL